MTGVYTQTLVKACMQVSRINENLDSRGTTHRKPRFPRSLNEDNDGTAPRVHTYQRASVQSRTSKHDKLGSGRTRIFWAKRRPGTNSGKRKESENVPPRFFPRVNSAGQYFGPFSRLSEVYLVPVGTKVGGQVVRVKVSSR